MMKPIVGRFIGGPMDKVVRALEYAYPVFYYPRMQKVTLAPFDPNEAIALKRAEYVCLEDVNELGQHLYLYMGTK
jgi:hypothetical protein